LTNLGSDYVPIVKNAFYGGTWFFVGNGISVGVQEYDFKSGFLTKFLRSDICHSVSTLFDVLDTQSQFDEINTVSTGDFTLSV